MIIKTVEQGSCGFLIVPNPANKQTQMVNNYKDVDKPRQFTKESQDFIQ